MDVGCASLDFNRRTYVMGILNVTPDSFSDGGRFFDPKTAIDHALQMQKDGADILDVGGESTRPGSDSVSEKEEIDRVVPVIRELSEKLTIPLSIDTTKVEVARAALDAGASLVNDISGMTFEPEMASLVAQRNVPVVIMHTADKPKTMQKTFRYDDVIEDVFQYFNERIEAARFAGIEKSKIILDPGIGFGKSVEQNFQLIRQLGRFLELGCPLLLGPSRKSFIGAVLDLPVDDRLEGTLAAVTACVLNGASIVRVHDVRESVRVCRISDAIIRKSACC